MSGNGALAVRDEAVATVKGMLIQNFKAIRSVIPRHVSPERLTRIALTTFSRTPGLLKCTPESFVGSVLQAAALGLEPGDGLGTCYIVPYWNRKIGREEAQFQVGYQGLIELARRTGALSTVYAREVYRDEAFEYELGLDPKLVHIPGDEDDPKLVTHVYAVAHLKDGGKQFEVMTRRQIEGVRNRSKAGQGGPWVTDWIMMARKTVIRRLMKYLPKSPEMARAVALEAQADLGQTQDLTLEAIATADASIPVEAEVRDAAPAEAKPDPLTALVTPKAEETTTKRKRGRPRKPRTPEERAAYDAAKNPPKAEPEEVADDDPFDGFGDPRDLTPEEMAEYDVANADTEDDEEA